MVGSRLPSKLLAQEECLLEDFLGGSFAFSAALMNTSDLLLCSTLFVAENYLGSCAQFTRHGLSVPLWCFMYVASLLTTFEKLTDQKTLLIQRVQPRQETI